MEPGIYERDVKGKSDEEVLIAAGQRLFSNETPYLQMAAQVRATQSLVAALKKASEDSGAVSARLFWLTLALVGAALIQAMASGWPYLTWWANHKLHLSVFR